MRRVTKDMILRAINWPLINLPMWRRVLVQFQVAVSFIMKGTPLKNRWYLWMGGTQAEM